MLRAGAGKMVVAATAPPTSVAAPLKKSRRLTPSCVVGTRMEPFGLKLVIFNLHAPTHAQCICDRRQVLQSRASGDPAKFGLLTFDKGQHGSLSRGGEPV